MMSAVGRAIAGRPRLLFGCLCGTACWFALPASLQASTRAVIAWDTLAATFLILVLHLALSERRDRMAEDSERQQEGEWTAFWLTLAAIGFSVVTIFTEFGTIKDRAGPAHVALVAATLILSWLMTHVVFALRYAHEYYERTGPAGEIDRGLQFPGTGDPDYFDFIYFALVLGMTFQVSDVQITARPLRRLATLHGLVGFLFSTIIIALTVNLASGLL